MLKGQVGQICFFRILEDEDLIEAVRKRVEQSGTKCGAVFVIGALKKAVLGYYKDGRYDYIRLDGPLEIASGMGNIAIGEKGETIIHMHLVVSNEKAEAFGGHLTEGSPVGATAELVIIEGAGVDLRRARDAKTGLNLLRSS